MALPALYGNHAHDLVALELRLERAADAAIGAGGDDRALGRALVDDAFSLSVAVGQACTQAPQETHSDDRKSTPPGETFESKPRPEDGQRERALHLLAGAHAARADDAFRGFEGEIGIGRVGRRRRDDWRRRSRSARRAGRRRRPASAIRNRRWRCRSGSRADGRRYRAPSRRAAASRAAASGCGRPCPSSAGVVQEAGVPLRPSISTRQRRQEPNASRLSVAQSFGIGVADQRRGRHDRGSRGTLTSRPSMVSVTVGAPDADRRAGVEFLQERHGEPPIPPRRAAARLAKSSRK